MPLINKWFLCLLLIPAFSLAQKPEVFSVSDQAIRGFDPVAYFTEGYPAEGLKQFHYRWNNSNWYFSSEKNLKLFIADPEKFAPQYGGWCAYGMAKGYKAKTEPDAWSIVGGKLYLNYSTGIRDEWNKKQSEYISAADKNWPTVRLR
ncbi:MAG: YHS domain protein [Chitinophagales bacterium]|nr:YHS domain protein [Chitinophagales bacterium]